MKLKKLSCPSCGANINLEIENSKSVFCPFCGNQFSIDNEESVQTQNINIHARYTNDAKVMREIKEDRENERRSKDSKYSLFFGFAMFVLVFAACFGMLGLSTCSENKERQNEQKEIAAGKIKVGQSSTEIEGKKYTAVVAELELAGFTNISTVDLDDAGLFKNKKDTVGRISIDGRTSFSASDYFYPNVQIIISYH